MFAFLTDFAKKADELPVMEGEGYQRGHIHTGFEKHQTRIQDGDTACDFYHLDIRTGFPQASAEQLFINLQEVLERT